MPDKKVDKAEWETIAPDEEKYCPVCGAYSPEEEMFRSRDKYGMSTLLHVRIPPDVAAQLETIVQSGKFEYKTAQDIIREAIGHRLFYLRKKLPSLSVDSTLARLRSIHKMLEDEDFITGFEADMENLKKAVKFKLTHGGDLGKESAKRLVAELLDRVSRLGIEYYQTVYTRYITKEYKELLEER